MGILSGKVAVVTGAGRGLGREFALCLAAQGANVVVNDLGVSLSGDDSGDDPASQVCKEIEALGVEAVRSPQSVAEFDSAAEIVQCAIDAWGRVDIVVNNAGIVRDRTLMKMDESDFDAVVGTHMKGTFNVVRHAAPHMKTQEYGRIINITSSAGLRGNFGQTNYGAAKAGIMGMTFVWALEMQRYGITVNALAPAGVTRMTGSLADGEAVPATLDPSLNAPLVAFLASEHAAHVNGQVFGRTDFSYTIFQHPKQIAWMHRDGGWDVDGVVEEFGSMLGQHLQQVGMVMPKGLSQDEARS
jgi:NAD(P)-dependent dehydrogenase (short-subunit alcohol dehydrogenase family)